MLQSSFAKRASGLCVDVAGMGVEATSNCSCKRKVIGKSTFICSIDRGKGGLAENSWSSEMICSTGATTATMDSPSAEDGTHVKMDNNDKLSPIRGEKNA
jgi:hypothetical protein